ncbi:MAG: FAD:protein FMN transferase [Verrucomicrobia bacterium]|jgi:thiamine biosynthesis lipoprotein|nr:FAD:protein FMN transferase [Verrucomicrobiota bacterium]
MPTVTLARHAMATRFELVLHGDHPAALRAAGEEALAEIDRLENQLSLYRPGSEIAQLNARAAREAVRVTPAVFALLQHAQQLHAETGGAFDITIAPLVRAWGFLGGTGKMPTPEAVAEARGKVGMSHVRLDPQNRTVRFARDGVMIDLGAIGKGYAVGQAAEILREAGVTSALIHGGTSTVYAIGGPPGGGFWKVAIETPPASVWSSEVRRVLPPHEPPAAFGRDAFHPRPKLLAGKMGTRWNASLPVSEVQSAISSEKSHPDPLPLGEGEISLPTVSLCDEAMSVSAMWGRSFQSGGTIFGHVIDPRTGQPVNRSLLAVVVLPSATETDALSTALLTLGGAGHESIARLRPGMKTLLVARTETGLRAEARGFEALPNDPFRTLKK